MCDLLLLIIWLLLDAFTKRGVLLALAGGGEWIPAMAGSLHPPFSLFLPEEKEKTGRARSKREKEVIWPSIGRTPREVRLVF
jgi:hypothetical protein